MEYTLYMKVQVIFNNVYLILSTNSNMAVDIREVHLDELIEDIIPEIRKNQQYLMFKKLNSPKQGLMPIMEDLNDKRIQTLHVFGKFEVLSLLGKGSFGFVWRVKHLITEKEYAIKIIPKESIIKHNDINHINLERKILQAVGCENNPSIVTLYHSLQDEKNVYFIMEVCYYYFMNILIFN